MHHKTNETNNLTCIVETGVQVWPFIYKCEVQNWFNYKIMQSTHTQNTFPWHKGHKQSRNVWNRLRHHSRKVVKQSHFPMWLATQAREVSVFQIHFSHFDLFMSSNVKLHSRFNTTIISLWCEKAVGGGNILLVK